MNLGKKCNGFLKTAIRSVDEAGLKITHTINTKALDRYYTSVLPQGADVKHFLNNAVVLWSHNMDEATPKIPIGRCIDLDIREDEIIATTEFNKNDPLAVKVFNAYKDGFLHAWSIGFMPIKYKEVTLENREELNSEYKLNISLEQLEEAGMDGAYVVHKWELREYSAVPVPGNPEALSADKVDFFKRELVTRGLVKESDVDTIEIKKAKGKKEEKDEYSCECLDCGEEVKSKEHCKDIKCPKCGGEMRRKDRTGTGKDAEVEVKDVEVKTRDAEEVSKEVKAEEVKGEETVAEKVEVKEEVKPEEVKEEKVEEVKAEEVKVEEVKEEAKAEEVKTEEPKAEEVKTEVKVKEVKEEEAKAEVKEENKAEEPKTEVKEEKENTASTTEDKTEKSEVVEKSEVKVEEKAEEVKEEETPANFASIIKDLLQKNKELLDRLEVNEAKLEELASVNSKVDVIQKSLDVDNIDKVREASQKRKSGNSDTWFSTLLRQ